MVMRNGRDSGNTQRHWWDDLPPAIRHRFRNTIAEELVRTTGADPDNPARAGLLQRTTSSGDTTGVPRGDAKAEQRKILWDLVQLGGSLLLIALMILLLLIAGIAFLFSGHQLGPWHF
ncbi:MAG: hypothetical protein RMJ88_02840 [Thermogemmata sp.]|nr:hypothetical protein [Thermogemmata sp.]